MIITTQNILLLGSILLFISIMIGKTGIKLGIPVLLLFLIVGMGFGRDGFGIEFENPVTAQFIGVISLSIILFSGGMDTNITEIKPVIGQGITLATLGVLLTTAFTGGFVYLLASWAFPEAQAPFVRMFITSCRHVIHRLSLSIQYITFQRLKSKTQPTSPA